MDTPRVNPVGLVEYPDDFDAHPRQFSRPMRVFSTLMLFLFFAATVITGALSLGAYCLTTDAGDTRALRAGVERWNGSEPEDSAQPPAPVD